MCAHAHYERETRSLFRQGPGPAYKGPKSFRVLCSLSCYLSLILSILIQNGIKTNILNQILGGGARLSCALPPPPPPLWIHH